MTHRFIINPMPKVRMTGRSKFANPRARACLEYQTQIATLAKFERVELFGSQLVGFSKLIFRRFGRLVDSDNLEKSFFDGLQFAGVFKNDNQIRAIDGLRVEYVDHPQKAMIEFDIYAIMQSYENTTKQNDRHTGQAALL